MMPCISEGVFLRLLKRGEIGEIYLAYTIFKNTVVHIPVLVKLLPACTDDFAGEKVLPREPFGL